MPIAPVEEFGPANQENEEGVKRRSNQGQEKIKEEKKKKKKKKRQRYHRKENPCNITLTSKKNF